jgi:hypothetical protein
VRRASSDQVADPLNRARSQFFESRPDARRLEKLVRHFLVMARDGFGLQLFHRV